MSVTYVTAKRNIFYILEDGHPTPVCILKTGSPAELKDAQRLAEQGHRLIDVTDIQPLTYIAVALNRQVSTLTKYAKLPSFPKPLRTIGNAKVYHLPAVEAWARKQNWMVNRKRRPNR